MSYVTDSTGSTSYPCIDTAQLHAKIADLQSRVETLEEENENEEE